MSETARRMSRRAVLRGAGAVTILLLGGGVYRAVDQGVFSIGQGAAYEPWATWRSEPGEGAMALVRAAILAANPHNSQPWYFRVGEATIDVYADTARSIGTIDPFLREMYIGLGCALENLLLAAEPNGYAADLALLPEPADPTHVARVTLRPAPPRGSALYEAIPRRHTNRGPYDTAREVGPSQLAALAGLATDADVGVRWYVSPEERARVGEVIVAASEALTLDPQQSRDSEAWFHYDWDALQQRRDGVTLDAQSLPAAIEVAAKLLPSPSLAQSNASFIEATRDRHVATAGAFGLLVVRDANDAAQRLRGGRLWQRMQLWGTTKGLAMQPLNQPAERADREQQLGIEPRFGRALAELVGDPAWHALMPFRLGYPTLPGRPSPRRDAADVLQR